MARSDFQYGTSLFEKTSAYPSQGQSYQPGFVVKFLHALVAIAMLIYTDHM